LLDDLNENGPSIMPRRHRVLHNSKLSKQLTTQNELACFTFCLIVCFCYAILLAKPLLCHSLM